MPKRGGLGNWFQSSHTGAGNPDRLAPTAHLRGLACARYTLASRRSLSLAHKRSTGPRSDADNQFCQSPTWSDLWARLDCWLALTLLGNAILAAYLGWWRVEGRIGKNCSALST
ncbi:hypothetical protein BDV93DRAFT_89562 [Ceratobasidium sp. AG-I]|nr:hypothetical protein BDV93DRAFT_171334 [Ceratobasidium sp. AG-I]KAF8595696.1 hypothetical protein BDV93DRAFT_89562 [Ceratobasidium sp. AG-I]